MNVPDDDNKSFSIEEELDQADMAIQLARDELSNQIARSANLIKNFTYCNGGNPILRLAAARQNLIELAPALQQLAIDLEQLADTITWNRDRIEENRLIYHAIQEELEKSNASSFDDDIPF